jgi:hypothetical protein
MRTTSKYAKSTILCVVGQTHRLTAQLVLQRWGTAARLHLTAPVPTAHLPHQSGGAPAIKTAHKAECKLSDQEANIFSRPRVYGASCNTYQGATTATDRVISPLLFDTHGHTLT